MSESCISKVQKNHFHFYMCPVLLPSTSSHHFLVVCKLTNCRVIPVQFKNHPPLSGSTYLGAQLFDMHRAMTEARGAPESCNPVVPITAWDCSIFTLNAYISSYWLDFKKYHFWNSPVKLWSTNTTGSRTQSGTVAASLKTVLDFTGRVICFKVLS